MLKNAQPIIKALGDRVILRNIILLTLLSALLISVIRVKASTSEIEYSSFNPPSDYATNAMAYAYGCAVCTSPNDPEEQSTPELEIWAYEYCGVDPDEYATFNEAFVQGSPGDTELTGFAQSRFLLSGEFMGSLEAYNTCDGDEGSHEERGEECPPE